MRGEGRSKVLCVQVVLEQAQLPSQAPAPTAVAAALTAPQVVSQSLKARIGYTL